MGFAVNALRIIKFLRQSCDFGLECHFNIRNYGAFKPAHCPNFQSCSNKYLDFYSVQYYCRWQRCHPAMTYSLALHLKDSDPHANLKPLLSSVCFHRQLECVSLSCLCGDLLADWPLSLSAAFHNATSFCGAAIQLQEGHSAKGYESPSQLEIQENVFLWDTTNNKL